MKNTQLMAALLAVFNYSHQRSAARRKPTGGHREPGYKRTDADHKRLALAEMKQIRKGIKRQRDYDRCIANNRCLK